MTRATGQSSGHRTSPWASRIQGAPRPCEPQRKVEEQRVEVWASDRELPLAILQLRELAGIKATVRRIAYNDVVRAGLRRRRRQSVTHDDSGLEKPAGGADAVVHRHIEENAREVSEVGVELKASEVALDVGENVARRPVRRCARSRAMAMATGDRDE